MRLWKILGLAGLAGVAATGVVIVRAERRRRAYTPDQVRERLHARVAAAAAEPEPLAEPRRRWLSRFRRPAGSGDARSGPSAWRRVAGRG